MDITLVIDSSNSNQIEKDLKSNEAIESIIQSGSFVTDWPSSNITARLTMSYVSTNLDNTNSWWRLNLYLSSFILNANSNAQLNTPDNRWPQDTLNVFEEFFHNRVCLI